MALPPASIRPALVPAVESATPVTPLADKSAHVTPVDLLIFTSEEDWENETDALRKAAATAAVETEVLFAENLSGWSAEDKLASLGKTLGAWLDNGKIHASTVIYVSLHGKEEALTNTGSADATSQTTYVFTAADANLRFPGAALSSALRHLPSSAGTLQQDFHGLIVWAACRVRKMEAALQSCAGENILLAGNKEVLSADSEECMLEVIDLMGARKREDLPSLTGRDYWMHLRNLSGEHIAYVQDTSTEIHKVLACESGEPTLTSRPGRSADQPRRILEAKLSHGSAKALQAVFDKYGKDHFPGFSRAEIYAFLALDTTGTTEKLLEKMAVLEKHGWGFPRDTLELADYLENCIECSNARMLSTLLRSQSEQLTVLLPEAIDFIVRKMASDLIELFSENEDIAQQWLAMYLQAQPPEIRQAIDRYLKHSLTEKVRPYVTNHLCLAGRDKCLMNLLRNAFERNKDLDEAESLMPFVLGLRKSSDVYSYLNLLLEQSMTHPDGLEIQKILARYGIEKINYADLNASINRFTNHRPWID